MKCCVCELEFNLNELNTCDTCGEYVCEGCCRYIPTSIHDEHEVECDCCYCKRDRWR